MRLKIDNYDYTTCGILNDFLQSHNKVVFSAVAKPDHLIDQIVITLKTLQDNPFNILFETIDYTVDVFETVKKELLKLNKKTVIKKK